jgi:hypothetical protein
MGVSSITDGARHGDGEIGSADVWEVISSRARALLATQEPVLTPVMGEMR